MPLGTFCPHRRGLPAVVGIANPVPQLRSLRSWGSPAFQPSQAAPHSVATRSADFLDAWHPLSRPLLWQGDEAAALAPGSLPSGLSPPWKVRLALVPHPPSSFASVHHLRAPPPPLRRSSSSATAPSRDTCSC